MSHSSPEFAAIAEHGTILRTQVGSSIHGLLTQAYREGVHRG